MAPNRDNRRRDRSRSDRRNRNGATGKTRQDDRAKQRCSSSSSPAKAVPAPAETKPAKKTIVETATVRFEKRPFGMAPAKEEKGYMVEKVAEGKPAAEAGVDVGWRVLKVSGQDCSEKSSAEIQALLKEVSLPVEVQFQKPEEEALPSSEEDENNIQNVRADHRRQHEAALSNIDDLPVHRDPEELPEPIASWRDACERKLLNASLVHKLHAAGLKRPTLIQRHAVPIVGHQEHYDLVAQAQTGSGKTFAFVIPTIARLLLRGCPARPFFAGPTAQGCPVVLVLSPTRELAIQTCSEMEVMTKGSKLTQMSIYGGETIKESAKRLETAPIDILCATPGRLIALLDETKISLAYVQTVILDEADQMLEQRLEIMCADILVGRDMPAPSWGRQTLLFSATIPQKIKDMCPQILREKRTAHLTIGFYDDDKGGSCDSITQLLRWSPDEKDRIGELIRDLQTYWDRKKGRVVIFSNLRLTADSLAHQLKREGMTCRHLHGKLDQEVREKVFDGFRRGDFDILVATNVASRGLDFPDVSLVVQFNLPDNIDVYTHRVGRTGRIGQVGHALAYLGPKDKKIAAKLVEFLELNKQNVPDYLRDMAIKAETLKHRY